MTLDEYKKRHPRELASAGLADVPDLWKYLHAGPDGDTFHLTMVGLKHCLEHGKDRVFVENIKRMHHAARIEHPHLVDVRYSIGWPLGSVSYREDLMVWAKDMLDSRFA